LAGSVVKPIVFEVNKLNLLFQKNDVDIGSAYDDITNLILLLAKKIYKPAFFSNYVVNVVLGNFENPFAFCEPNEADFGIDYNNALRQLDVSHGVKCTVENKSFNYIKHLMKELIKRLPENLELFRKLKVFSPGTCLSQVKKCKFEQLPFLHEFANKNKLFVMENQYNMLNNLDWGEIYGEHIYKSAYTFWPIVALYKDAGDKYAFEDIAQFVIKVLCLPSSNPTVERCFSIMNAIKIKSRNKLNPDMLNELMQIGIELHSNNGCCKNFNVSKNMFTKFNSKTMYPKLVKSETDDENAFQEITIMNL
jgi:hypothetical protein